MKSHWSRLSVLGIFLFGIISFTIYSQAALLPEVPVNAAFSTDPAPPPDPQIPSKQLITPEQLTQMMKSQKPLILAIGPRSMYQQAHITGSEYIGAGSSPEGLDALRARVKSLPKNQLIVIYCGCCPWNHCPNVHPAYKLLRDLGYTNARVLYMADNFGTDWVYKGYPTAGGD